MNGINILHQTRPTQEPDWFITAIILMLIGIVLGVLVLCVLSKDTLRLISICVLVVIIMLVILCIAHPKVTTDTQRLEILVDDSVSFNKFHNKYKIIEQRGKIWVVEEKDVNKTIRQKER